MDKDKYHRILIRELLHHFDDADVAIKLLNDYTKASEEIQRTCTEDNGGEDLFWSLLIFLCEIPGVARAIYDVIPSDWLYDSQRFVDCPAPVDYVSAYILDLIKVSRKADIKI